MSGSNALGHTYAPATHSVALFAPSTKVVVPPGQLLQSDAAELPREVLYLPRSQSVHEEEPKLAANEPGEQDWQAEDEAAEKYPGEHGAQEPELLAPGRDEKVPEGHCVHAIDVWPGAGLKVPAGQSEQLSEDVAPGALLKAPVGQSEQEEAPSALEKEPGEHKLQPREAAADVYEPRGQSEHASAREMPPAFTPKEPAGQVHRHEVCPVRGA